MCAAITSPVVIGRDDEMTLLRSLWRGALDGVPKGVIVSGEAGIGKSRLLREFARELGPDAVVATGYCDRLGTLGQPFAPIREAMLALITQLGMDEVRGHLTPSHLHDLSALLPELLPESDDATAPASHRAGAVHAAVRDALVLLSEIRPVLVVLEDLHWADAATLDLLRAVVSRFSTGRVLLSVTSRDDEAGPDNAFGQFLAEFDRLNEVLRIDLTRLTPGEVATLAMAIRGPDHGLDGSELARRSDGVPFLVEELLAVGDQALPGSLRGVVLARYHQASTRTREVLRELAVGGSTVPHPILEKVHGGDPDELGAALWEAFASHLVVARGAHYVFRHALTREAVDAEVPPWERSRLHQRYAQALEETDGDSAEIAHHRLALGDTRGAFAALIRATRDAQAAGAVASAARFGEQALELWDSVPDAAALAGSSRAALALDAVSSFIETGDTRSITLLNKELAVVPPDDRRGRALLLHEQALLLQALGSSDIRAPMQAALDALPEPADDEDLLARIRVTCGVGSAHSISGDAEVAASALEWAAEQARILMRTSEPLRRKAEAELVRVLTRLTSFRVRQGDPDGALAALTEVESLDRSPAALTLLAVAQVELLRALGRNRDCLEVALDALRSVDTLWLGRSWGGALLLHVMFRRLEVGDLDGAERTLMSLRALPPLPFVRAYCRVIEWEILRLRDHAAETWAEYEATPNPFAGIAGAVHGDLTLALPVAHLALDVGEHAAAWREVSRLWEDKRVLADVACFPLVLVGAEVLANVRDGALDGVDFDEGAERLRAVLARLSMWPQAGDWEALVEAYLSGDDPVSWERAVAAARLGRVPAMLVGEALFGLGHALIGAARRDDARARLEEARVEAERIGDLRMVRRVGELLHGAGLDGTDAVVGPEALTPRERQVLALIAEGLTNRQIGRRLFISEKTASVHVSAILRKLGVASRTEAAVRAVAE